MGLTTANLLAQQRFGKLFDELSETRQASIKGVTATLLKENRYDPDTGVLIFTQAQMLAWEYLLSYY